MPKRIHLTDLALRALKFSDTQTTYWDKDRRGFGVRVGKRSKTFIVVHSNGRRIKLGTYPETKLHEARELAKQAVANPPMATARANMTVIDAATRFFEAHAHKNRKSTAVETQRLLRKHMLPDLGEMKLAEVDTAQLMDIVDGLMAKPPTAIHVFVAMRTFFNWSVSRRFLKYSPLSGLPLPAKRNKRDHVLSDVELVAIHRAAEKMGHPFGFIIMICMHTGMRRGETASLKWNYITPEHITLPGEVTKSGQQLILPNHINHILQRIPMTAEYLFASSSDTPFSGWDKGKRGLDALSGVSDWVIHDLRRTFATKMAEWQLAPPHVIERILNHATGSMTPIARIYNRWNYLAEMKEAMQRYEARLANLLATTPDGLGSPQSSGHFVLSSHDGHVQPPPAVAGPGLSGQTPAD